MKRIVILSLGVLVTFALVAGAYADQGQAGSGGAAGPGTGKKAESPAQAAPGPIISPKTAGHIETIEGELLRIDKDLYVVKDVSGKEVSLLVDKDTKVEGNIAAHDQIVAQATALKKEHAQRGNWHADSIKKR